MEENLMNPHLDIRNTIKDIRGSFFLFRVRILPRVPLELTSPHTKKKDVFWDYVFNKNQWKICPDFIDF